MYPALAVLQALTSKVDQVLWVGGEGGLEVDMIKRENIPFEAIPAAGIHGVSAGSLPGNILRLFRGYVASRRILKKFKPDVLVFTGGYVAVPMALAGIPYQSMLYVPDIEPGLALKTIARYSDHIAVTNSESLKYFRGKTPVSITGYPTRSDLKEWTKEKAAQLFDLVGNKPVLLVLGGSKGARSINQAINAHLTDLLEVSEIIHITGQLDFADASISREKLTKEQKTGYHLYPYLHNIGAALAAADLAVSRAGASTLGEYPLFGVPAILVPYPYAWRYQKVNADYLVDHEAALVLDDSRLMNDLLPLVRSILNHPEKLGEMRQNTLKLATPDAAAKIAAIVTDLSARNQGGRTSW